MRWLIGCEKTTARDSITFEIYGFGVPNTPFGPRKHWFGARRFDYRVEAGKMGMYPISGLFCECPTATESPARSYGLPENA
jgi:hypothetical protein